MTNRFIRVATPDDIPALLQLAQRFVSESSYGMEFDEAGAREYLETVIQHPDTAMFVNDDVSAGVLCSLQKDFCTKSICYIDYFFVSQHLRGSGIDRVFMQAVITFARLNGAVKVHAFNHFAFNPTIGKRFQNLLSKNGFMDAGLVSVRGM